ncbi:hypothetical protein SAMN04488063_2318 [Halopelagius inordinatus]|uniref:Uncharacterized protein n=1 Tax=Halopelagius inordinatus TaxID=553467 RepID=A0A1I2SJQ4_9EURY|nr:hypothetical protein [Halopelagius inordinatus]SFG52912.1 hypothetical protein SAMN04488063_2318 [Halopelagius inordinatus]
MSDDESGRRSSDAEEESRIFALTRDKLLLITILFLGIAGSGIARRVLGELGYNEVGRVVFILGYVGMIIALWYGWIRPLDITGPTER